MSGDGRGTGMASVRHVTARSALSPSGLEGLDYSLNPYRGCQNGCRYCYSPSVLREERPWGTFVDVRHNIPRVLAKEVRRKRKGIVGISTVTDPYQDRERQDLVTRHCLEVLLRAGWPVSVQTKRALVTRDIDVLRRFPKVDVGMTMTSADEKVKRAYEPGASSPDESFKALEELAAAGIETWVYIAPIVPFVTEETAADIVRRAAKAGVSTVMVDGLRARGRSWESLEPFYESWRPELLDDYRRLKAHGRGYFEGVARDIEAACRDAGIRCRSFVGSDQL